MIENNRKDNKSNANKSNKNGNYGEIEEASNNINEGNTLQEGIVEMDKEGQLKKVHLTKILVIQLVLAKDS